MRHRASIALRPCEVLSFLIVNVFSCLRFSVPFGEAVVYQEEVVHLFPNANHEVVGFYIAVDEVAGVQELNSLQELVDQHEDCFHRELPLAVLEELFEARPHEIGDQNVVFALLAEHVDVWDANTSLENFVELGFIL